MNPFAVLGRRVRGFRVIDLICIAILAVLAPAVYLTKASAGATRADIDTAQQQIVEEKAQIRLLRADVTSEEQPERLAMLSAQFLRLQPISASHEIAAETLSDVVHAAAPKPALVPAAAQVATPAPGPAVTGAPVQGAL